MGASAPQATNIGEKAGCGGCALPLFIGVFTIGLVVTVYYFGDIHNVQMLHAGDETRFDPIASFPYARSLAASDGSQLDFLQMTARFVGSDGTLDLAADYEPSVTYQWVGPYLEEGNRPVGAGGNQRRLLVTVRATDFGFEHTGSGMDGAQYYDLNMGLRRREGWFASEPRTVAPPNCSLRQLWAAAIEAGAPSDAVAIIHYNFAGYDFDIEGTPFEMSFDRDCKPRE